jgi:hypothetical protein
MPLQIRERKPRKFNVVKPRNDATTEKQAMKQTAGSTRPETLQSVAKQARQQGKDLGGRGGWKAPSHDQHGQNPQIQDNMNKNYEDHFFKINRGHNRGSVRPQKHHPKQINSTDYFR